MMSCGVCKLWQKRPMLRIYFILIIFVITFFVYGSLRFSAVWVNSSAMYSSTYHGARAVEWALRNISVDSKAESSKPKTPTIKQTVPKKKPNNAKAKCLTSSKTEFKMPNELLRPELIKPGMPLNNSFFNNIYTQLPRAIPPDEKTVLFELLSEFMKLLDAHDIEYFMAYGTLMGSFFFHDEIPWDDDMDLLLNVQDINKLRAMMRDKTIRKTYGFHSFWDPVDQYAEDVIDKDIPLNDTLHCLKKPKKPTKKKKCYQMGKIYRNDGRSAGGYPWNYPFVDFSFYFTDDKYLYNQEYPKAYKVLKSDIFPFHLRPLNNVWIPAPKKVVPFLGAKYKDFACKQGFWNHRKETGSKLPLLSANCEDFKHCYPHVQRRNATRNNSKYGVIEDLVLDGVVIQSVLIEEPYEAQYDLTLNK